MSEMIDSAGDPEGFRDRDRLCPSRVHPGFGGSSLIVDRPRKSSTSMGRSLRIKSSPKGPEPIRPTVVEGLPPLFLYSLPSQFRVVDPVRRTSAGSGHDPPDVVR